jgi:hypothetical protein
VYQENRLETVKQKSRFFDEVRLFSGMLQKCRNKIHLFNGQNKIKKKSESLPRWLAVQQSVYRVEG